MKPLDKYINADFISAGAACAEYVANIYENERGVINAADLVDGTATHEEHLLKGEIKFLPALFSIQSMDNVWFDVNLKVRGDIFSSDWFFTVEKKADGTYIPYNSIKPPTTTDPNQTEQLKQLKKELADVHELRKYAEAESQYWQEEATLHKSQAVYIEREIAKLTKPDETD